MKPALSDEPTTNETPLARAAGKTWWSAFSWSISEYCEASRQTSGSATSSSFMIGSGLFTPRPQPLMIPSSRITSTGDKFLNDRGRRTRSRSRTRSTRRSRGPRRRSRKSLSGRQLFECEPGNLRRVFNPQPANRNDLLGDKLRDGVAAILQTQRTQGLFVSRHQTFNVLRLEHSVLYQLVNSHRFRQRAAARFRRSLKLRGA